MKLVDSFISIEPVCFYDEHIWGWGKADHSNVFESYYLAKVMVYEEKGRLYYKKEVIDSPEYQRVLNKMEGRNQHNGFKELGVSLEGTLSRLEAEELRANMNGAEGDAECFMHALYDNDESFKNENIKNVLVLGPGTGIDYICDIEYVLEGHKPDIVAIDINKKSLKVSQSNNENTKNIMGNIAKLPFRQNKFDCVVANLIYSSLLWPRPAVEETARILRPGGLLVVQECYLDNKYMEKMIKESGFNLEMCDTDKEYSGMPLSVFIARRSA